MKMDVSDFLAEDQVIGDLRSTSKKALLQNLSGRLARSLSLNEADVFDALMARERLGSTGVGHGVAIPHARLDGLGKIAGLFARLATPIDFESIDEEPVDLVFLLLAPEDAGSDHLKALSRISRLLRDPNQCAKLRAADNEGALQALLIGPKTAAA